MKVFTQGDRNLQTYNLDLVLTAIGDHFSATESKDDLQHI